MLITSKVFAKPYNQLGLSSILSHVTITMFKPLKITTSLGSMLINDVVKT
jgi:hypothetical protein